jgi:NADH dehydrogenase
MLSFLRARPDAPSAYHRSKWAAEEAVRRSGLTWTILKSGMIYGRGDHMLDHLSRALHTIPLFALVGLRDRPVRPIAVADAVRVLEAAVLGDRRLMNRSLAVLGPEQLRLGDVVRRVSAVTGRRVLIVRLPVAAHVLIGWVAERLMTVPLIALAQVRILAEGVAEPAPVADELPSDLQPTTRLTADVIRAGLPPPGGFGLGDLRWFARRSARRPNPGPPVVG